MNRAVTLLICALVAISPATFHAAAQESDRSWPSQRPDAPTGPEDEPLGRSGKCRYDAVRYDRGETACITRHGEQQPALCGMSYNVTSWIWQDGTC